MRAVGVRVKIRIRYRDKKIHTTALVNTSYESDRPEIHIPIALAKKIGLSLDEARSDRYSVVGGEVNVFRLGQIYDSLDLEDFSKESKEATAEAVCVVGEYEVIINDALAEELGIEILAPRRGL